MKHILYLHGFNSSPASVKARQTAAWMAERGLADQFTCPALPFAPAAASRMIEGCIQKLGRENVTLVGSSLGGFYSTWASSRFGCPAALINPAVHPHQHLNSHVGPQRNMYTGHEYVLETRHMDELAALDPSQIEPARFWLLAESGDETLDYRDAVRYYAGGRQTIIGGGDHSLQSWPDLLPQIAAWAGLV